MRRSLHRLPRRKTRTRRTHEKTGGTPPGRDDDWLAEGEPVPTGQGEPLTSVEEGLGRCGDQAPPPRFRYLGTTFSVMLPTIELLFRSAIVIVCRPNGCSV